MDEVTERVIVLPLAAPPPLAIQCEALGISQDDFVTASLVIAGSTDGKLVDANIAYDLVKFGTALGIAYAKKIYGFKPQ